MQQIDVFAQRELSTAEVYLSLERLDNDTTSDYFLNGTSWPMAGASLLDSETSASDLAAALQSLPSIGDISVVRVPSVSVGDSSIASRHLVTFTSRGGDIPLLRVEEWTTTKTGSSDDVGTNR